MNACEAEYPSPQGNAAEAMRLRTELLLALAFVIAKLAVVFGFYAGVWFFLAPLLVLAVRGSWRAVSVVAPLAILLVAWCITRWLATYSPGVTSLMMAAFFGFYWAITLSTRALLHVGFPLMLGPPLVWFLLMGAFSLTLARGFWAELSMFHPSMAPLIGIVGARGITVIIVLMNSALACLMIHWLDSPRRATGSPPAHPSTVPTQPVKPRSPAAAVSVVAIIASAIAGCHLYAAAFRAPEHRISIAAIQGNFPQPWTWRIENTASTVLDTYARLTSQAAADRPDLIVWPEYAIAQDLSADESLSTRVCQVARDAQADLLLGSLRWLDGKTHGERNQSDLAILISSAGLPAGEYVSIRPDPYERWVIPGPIIQPLQTPRFTLGVMICFEETEPAIAMDLSRRGAQILISLSNNSRFNETVGVPLSALQSRLRAAENGKYLLRVANTGLTQLVDPCGRVVQALPPYAPGILNVAPGLTEQISFYSRHAGRPAWWLAGGMGFVGVLCGVPGWTKCQKFSLWPQTPATLRRR